MAISSLSGRCSFLSEAKEQNLAKIACNYLSLGQFELARLSLQELANKNFVAAASILKGIILAGPPPHWQLSTSVPSSAHLAWLCFHEYCETVSKKTGLLPIVPFWIRQRLEFDFLVAQALLESSVCSEPILSADVASELRCIHIVTLNAQSRRHYSLTEVCPSCFGDLQNWSTKKFSNVCSLIIDSVSEGTENRQQCNTCRAPDIIDLPPLSIIPVSGILHAELCRLPPQTVKTSMYLYNFVRGRRILTEDAVRQLNLLLRLMPLVGLFTCQLLAARALKENLFSPVLLEHSLVNLLPKMIMTNAMIAMISSRLQQMLTNILAQPLYDAICSMWVRRSSQTWQQASGIGIAQRDDIWTLLRNVELWPGAVVTLWKVVNSFTSRFVDNSGRRVHYVCALPSQLDTDVQPPFGNSPRPESNAFTAQVSFAPYSPEWESLLGVFCLSAICCAAKEKGSNNHLHHAHILSQLWHFRQEAFFVPLYATIGRPLLRAIKKEQASSLESQCEKDSIQAPYQGPVVSSRNTMVTFRSSRVEHVGGSLTFMINAFKATEKLRSMCIATERTRTSYDDFCPKEGSEEDWRTQLPK